MVTQQSRKLPQLRRIGVRLSSLPPYLYTSDRTVTVAASKTAIEGSIPSTRATEGEADGKPSHC